MTSALQAMTPNQLGNIDPMTDEEYEGNKANCDRLRHANARLIGELQKMGAEPDFSVSMLTVFFDGLVSVGVLTKAQLLVIQLGWENAFHKQLQAMHQQAAEMIATMEARAKLAVPGKGGGRGQLHIPGRG